MTALLDSLPAIVDIPNGVIVWKPPRTRRSAHWPRPNGCEDLGSYLVLRQLDLPGLDDDGLRDQLAIARHLLGAVLARSGSRLAEQWLRERLAAIGNEMRTRLEPPGRERRTAPVSRYEPVQALVSRPSGLVPVRRVR